MEWNDLTEGAKAVLEQTRNLKNDHIQIVEFEVGYEEEVSEENPHPISIQEEDYQNLKRFTEENEYEDRYHMARNKNMVKIILLEDNKIPDNLSEFPVFRQYRMDRLREEQARLAEEYKQEKSD
ncbi:putative Rossmann fold nucleotide-binding protein DprA/Smf involved in DNA uptake [Geomicrobium halophilum]|uniref:Putative Rossmann fold nucleotide-binding protein DprA/Smf involved in DNA uptake n=1 Tax=Geomicrobium halophilum TaxID=549000 RepID=A0A841PP04_9BACL|nr:hypothetical protein [Geomicrobium halophilum]MBB6448926.1 putative Rossmann fold nucleotide-binding protein DprA/Smf involved in DNA uptake [Geomicrobium halophilum]